MTVTDSTATSETGPGPYGQHAFAYLRAGWSPLPLPPRAKKSPPTGWTGRDGTIPSGADVHAWAEEHANGNIALRLPPNVVGLDVDAYGDKAGGTTLAQLETAHGPLPATWRSTSRDDGTSGIRLFRIPAGLRWPSVAGSGIEIIRYEHRYTVAPPSIHPDTAAPYRWITPDGVPAIGAIPTPDDLPELPAAWLEHLTAGERATDQPTAGLTGTAAAGWLTSHGHGMPCRAMNNGLNRAMDALTAAGGGGRHDAALTGSNRLLWLAAAGHAGAGHALATLGAAFLAAITPERGADEAHAEWDRMLHGGINLAAAATTTTGTDPCTDPFHGLLPPGHTSPTASATATTTSGNGSTPPTHQDPSTTSSSAASAADATEPPPSTELTEAQAEVSSRLKPGGAFILDIPEHIPAIWGLNENVLWAEGEALTICGPPGVGKTTLTGQVVRARIAGGDVLGYPVQPTESRVLYLAMDRPRQIARALRRTLADLGREMLDERLIVWPGPPIADVAAHPATLLGLVELAKADTVIIDSIKDAAIGLSSDEVGAGYNRARQMCIAAGIEVLELHHMVKKGDGGGAPTSLADMYGSVWIGAGAGSVVLLHGSAGDPIVSMSHLKTPAEEVGPFRLRHDHDLGVTEIFHSTDILGMARLAGSRGITAKAVAQAVEEKDNPKEAAIEKARRQLSKLEQQGHLMRVDGSKGGVSGGTATKWIFIDIAPTASGPVEKVWKSDHETDHDRDRSATDHERSRPITTSTDSAQKTDHGSDHGDHGQTDHVSLPPFRGGGNGRKTPIAGGKYLYDHETGQTLDAKTGEIQ